MYHVIGIQRLVFAVPNVQEVGTFYRDIWGMEALFEGDTEWLLRCRDSHLSDFVLVRSEAKAELAELTFEARNAEELTTLLSDAERAGGRVLRSPSVSPGRPAEWAAAIADPDGNRIGIVTASHGRAPLGTRSGQSGPHRIGHVVFWTPRIEAQEAFYAALGLRVTDRTAMGMSFLRCNADHHSLALVRSKGQIGVQHVAFDVGTLDAVMRECGRLKAAGVECVWGPGRHGPGGNVFAYYRDPAGIVIEFYGEMQKFSPDDDVVEPVFWGPEHRGDVWGLAGPAPEVFRP